MFGVTSDNRVVFLGLILGLLLFGSSCSDDKNTEEPEKTAILNFDETALPGDLEASGGKVVLTVEWAWNQWDITSEVVEGEAFISTILPAGGGSIKEGESTTHVEIEYEANDLTSQNRQKIILSSVTNDLSEEIILTQVGRQELPVTRVVIDPDIVHQTITGFGGANMIWGTDYLTEAEMDLAFGTDEEQLGLSIYRVRLSSNRSDWAALVNSVKMANDRGAKVLASPWSPPAEWKSNNSINGGGYLLKEHYADFAGYINEFIQFMADNGAVVDAVSIQNEPDWEVDYEGCEYTVAEMYDFVKNYAGVIQNAKVVAAESLNSNQAYTRDILNDPTAADNLDIVGGHLYGGGLAPYPLAREKGKEIWMTEYLLNLNSGNVPGNWTEHTDTETIWDETMEMLDGIHSAMTYDWNAYIWWYIRRYYSFLGDGNNGTQRGKILKRGYAFSHYSKFIRPGYQRIDVGTAGVSTLKMTAFRGDGNTVIVILNSSEYSEKTIEMDMPAGANSAIAFTTSSMLNRNKDVEIVSEGKVRVTLPRESVTTIVLN
ncbi:O-glycosyl hydrolase [Marinilabilia salmonicolor]|jgi:O-glycosyl hydrolase|uniref:glycoside hydrolase n=1 Tax=Marinilabilia salmonicolor TaxID=989 RepID=UPI000D075FBA|nr:glycoside hydrolase [Marinilabilia salmonicolor]PRY96630.1 O-glycosyl hydrolase [Marinilabilia salmonicolor]